MLLAFDGDELVGMASMSVVMGTLVQRVAYLEDFVVAKNKQGQGIGTTIWQEIIAWSKKKGCKRLEFTSSGKAEKAAPWNFIKNWGPKSETQIVSAMNFDKNKKYVHLIGRILMD